jgi:hypothetical protein
MSPSTFASALLVFLFFLFHLAYEVTVLTLDLVPLLTKRTPIKIDIKGFTFRRGGQFVSLNKQHQLPPRDLANLAQKCLLKAIQTATLIPTGPTRTDLKSSFPSSGFEAN